MIKTELMEKLACREANLNKELEAEGLTVEYMQKPVNVGEIKEGYMISRPTDIVNPILYYDKSWDEKGDKELAEELKEFYNNQEFPPTAQLIDFVSNLSSDELFRMVMPRIYGKEALEMYQEHNIVSMIRQNFCIIFYLSYTGRYGLIITNEFLDQFSVTEEMLYDHALRNVEQTAEIGRLQDMLFHLCGKEVPADSEMDPMKRSMLVLTNQNNYYGASVILSDKIRKKVYNMYENTPYYIIPSSVHEVITVPDSQLSTEELEEMVYSVNKTVLNPEDILSYQIYYYDGNLFRIATANKEAYGG